MNLIVPRGPVLAHIPSTVDLAAVDRPAWRDYAAYTISLVRFRAFMNKNTTDAMMVPLDSRFHSRFVPKEVRRPLLDQLIDAGILECDNTYRPGSAIRKGKSMCYRIGSQHRGVKARPVTMTQPVLLKKIEAEYRRQRDILTDPVHRAIREWHDRVTVLDEAPCGDDPALDSLIGGDRWFVACDKGRLHSAAGNVKRAHRQYLRLAGHRLWSVDVSATQPLILALLLAGKKPDTNGGALLPAVVGVPALTIPVPDSDSLLADCVAGTLYRNLSVTTERYGIDAVKPKLMAVIYGHPAYYTIVGRAFETLYPGVCTALRHLNLPYNLGKGKLPCLMQRIESDVMIQGAAARMLRGTPRVPFLTLHDALLVPEEHIELAKVIIRSEWRKRFGVMPLVKVKRW